MVSWACQGQALVRPASRRTIKRNTSDSKADQGTSKIIPHYGGSRGTSGLKMVPRVVGERARLLIEAQLGELANGKFGGRANGRGGRATCGKTGQ